MRNGLTTLGVVLAILSFLVLHPLCADSPVAQTATHAAACHHQDPGHDEFVSATPALTAMPHEGTPAVTRAKQSHDLVHSGQIAFPCAKTSSSSGRLLIKIGVSRT